MDRGRDGVRRPHGRGSVPSVEGWLRAGGGSGARTTGTWTADPAPRTQSENQPGPSLRGSGGGARAGPLAAALRLALPPSARPGWTPAIA